MSLHREIETILCLQVCDLLPLHIRYTCHPTPETTICYDELESGWQDLRLHCCYLSDRAFEGSPCEQKGIATPERNNETNSKIDHVEIVSVFPTI